MEKAGFNHVLLNEFDKFACQTLRANRPNWNVVEGDIHNIDFSPYEGKVHFLSGAFHVRHSLMRASDLALRKLVVHYSLRWREL